jgi:LPXTG-motif cell wall-anchored protein
LDAGTYFLQETKAPTGYNPLTEDIEVKITAAYNDDGKLNTGEGSGITVTAVTDASDSNTTIGYQITSKVGNSSGSELPETGGIGTTIFYVVGGIMMVVAIVLLVTKKKMSKK